MLNLSRENRRPVSRPAQVKTFLKTGGFRLSNFTLFSYNVIWILTITVLTNLRTREQPNPPGPLFHSAVHLFQSSVLVLQPKSSRTAFPVDWSPLPVKSPIGSTQILLNHFPTRPVTSSSGVSYWFSSSAPEQLSHSAGHLFQSTLLVVQLSSKLSENP